MRVGYAVQPNPILASFRLRVDIPSKHLGMPYVIGATGNPTFFYKNGNPRLAESLPGAVVYDVVNDHFKGSQAAEYHGMVSVATTITCASEVMAEVIREHTGRDATVIADPWETDEQPPAVVGDGVLWFGHGANIKSLLPYIDEIGDKLIVCSNIGSAHVPWSLENERRCLQGAAVAVLTGANAGASTNRVVKAIRAGRFVVAPGDCPQGWKDLLSLGGWRGAVADGVRWALNNREEACKKIAAGQDYIRQRFSPQLIGSQWAGVFALT